MKKDDWTRLCNKYYKKIVRWAVYKWGDQGEDAVQEAFLRAFTQRHKFNDSFSFVTWVYGFVPVIIADWYRNDKLMFDHSIDVFEIPDHMLPETYLFCEELIEFCNSLPEKQKEAIFSKIDSDDAVVDRKNLWWAKQAIRKEYNED